MKDFNTPSLRNHPRVRWRNMVRNWPTLVWLLLVVLAAHLYFRAGQFGGMTGVIETIPDQVAPLETARLQSIEVREGDVVTAGQVVARMDTALLDARRSLEESQLVEAETTIAGYQQNLLQLARQFERTIREAQSAREELRMQQDRDQAELDASKTELDRRTDLLNRQLINEDQLSDLRLNIAALEAGLEGYDRQLELADNRLNVAISERDEMLRWLRIEPGQNISEAIQRKMDARTTVLHNAQKLRELQREAYAIKAVRDGVVSRIFHEPGEVVQAGDAVVRLVSQQSDWVVGFLPEEFLADLQVGHKAWIQRANSTQGGAPAIVISVEPEVRALPGRISPIQGVSLRGRRVRLKLDGPHSFVPGETVRILSRKTHWSDSWTSWWPGRRNGDDS